MATTVADATKVDNDEATNGGHCRPTANVNDDEVTSGGRRRPTMAMTVANAANVNDDENGHDRRRRSQRR